MLITWGVEYSLTGTSTWTDGEAPTTKLASPPFDDTRGDVILRTADNVDFRVMKVILELSSPVFKDMFSMPQPSDGGDTAQIPIIPVSESSATLDALLRLCYPERQPKVLENDVALMENVLCAALKYDIDVASNDVRYILMDHAQESEENALAVYAIACSLKVEDVAFHAATESLKWPILETAVPQLSSISGLDCYNLLEFHRRTGKAAADLFHQYSFLKETCSDLFAPIHSCNNGDGGKKCVSLPDESSTYLYEWWAESRSAIENSLKIAPLDFERISLALIVPAVEQYACTECKHGILQGWEDAKRKMISEVEKVVYEVELGYSWKSEKKIS